MVSSFVPQDALRGTGLSMSGRYSIRVLYLDAAASKMSSYKSQDRNVDALLPSVCGAMRSFARSLVLLQLSYGRGKERIEMAGEITLSDEKLQDSLLCPRAMSSEDMVSHPLSRCCYCIQRVPGRTLVVDFYLL